MNTTIYFKLLRKIENTIKYLLFHLPYVRKYITKVPPGDYSSPIPSKTDIMKREKQIYDNINDKELFGINLNTNFQLEFIEKLKQNYRADIFTKDVNSLRYYENNGMFDYSDALFYHSIIRHFKPKRIIEIGSGFSSAIALDTNDHYLKYKMKLTFIEPYPERLYTLLTKNDIEDPNISIITDIVQTVNIDLFKQLKKNDIFFIDSSHVAKLGSDVNFILFEILPVLKKGVIIHFHDIFFPFEYYREFFIRDGGLFNEVYFLRTFLSFSNKFKIILWPHYLAIKYQDWFKINMPKVLDNEQYGGSIYLIKN